MNKVLNKTASPLLNQKANLLNVSSSSEQAAVTIEMEIFAEAKKMFEYIIVATKKAPTDDKWNKVIPLHNKIKELVTTLYSAITNCGITLEDYELRAKVRREVKAALFIIQMLLLMMIGQQIIASNKHHPIEKLLLIKLSSAVSTLKERNSDYVFKDKSNKKKKSRIV